MVAFRGDVRRDAVSHRAGRATHAARELARDSHKVAIEPAEPACSHGEGHDWQSPVEIVGGIDENPGVRGSGGGVIIDECCMHCGCQRQTDTWAQDRTDGEQGLTSVTYRVGHYDLPEAKS